MIMAHPTIVGRENLRGLDGPFLVSCNHVTYIDLGFALKALPPRLRRKLAVGMWGELLWEMWRPPHNWNWFMRLSYRVGYYLAVALFNVFPLPQQSGVRESFAYAGESIDRGYSVLVYPEGRRTDDGKPSPFRSGLGMLAARLNVPVLPLRIDGLYEMKTAGRKIARRGELKVVIGRPMTFPRWNSAGRDHEPGGRGYLEDVSSGCVFVVTRRTSVRRGICFWSTRNGRSLALDSTALVMASFDWNQMDRLTRFFC